MSLDLTILSIEDGNERWQTSRRRRIIQDLSVRERITPGAESGTSTIYLQLGSWLVDQLDAQTVAAIAWHVLRGLTGIAKRLAIYLAAHSGDFCPITRHTERFAVALTDELYEEFGSPPPASGTGAAPLRVPPSALPIRIPAIRSSSSSAPATATTCCARNVRAAETC